MVLWKIELYRNRDDQQPERWGVMVASSKEAAQAVADKMGSYKKADITAISLSEVQSLPEGTFFWKASDA